MHKQRGFKVSSNGQIEVDKILMAFNQQWTEEFLISLGEWYSIKLHFFVHPILQRVWH